MLKLSVLIQNASFKKIILWMLEIRERLKHTQQNNSYQQYLMNVIPRLENNSIETSLSAINDLEHLAKIQPQYHWVIMDMLTHFVRNKSPILSPEELMINSSTNIQEVIQAAITVIGRRDITKDPENEQIDLSYANLIGVNLSGANLAQTNLYQANLSNANLAGVNLEGAILCAANLTGANLNLANLSGAILSAANLSGANLSGANLHRANLYLASLQNAILNDTMLDGANLRETKFSF
ncbi:pentapeptide repeat-containing protein [Trichormus sp. NMC-1]|uniref:pentapeptide repeat-containing protein n=1 Tax=Trichormus sp. NMC-1 TaxID=1853259 RepID=UPI0008DC1156|nr:pentapeptide repeat-containing protein [Trichormus sp. NMC-1]